MASQGADLEAGSWLTRFILFTGKGGVGKTTTAAALAVSLADEGRRVLIVSTDPASNLSGVFTTEVGNDPTPIPGAAGLDAMDIDPQVAADSYRSRVLDPLRATMPAEEIDAIAEQLAGQCTVEVAAFDEFSGLLAAPDVAAAYDHIIFDTAPTGHTLRLLELPAAWSTFIESNPDGASCLGPASALGTKRSLYQDTVAALGDPTRTTVVLVTRPERGHSPKPTVPAVSSPPSGSPTSASSSTASSPTRSPAMPSLKRSHANNTQPFEHSPMPSPHFPSTRCRSPRTT